MTAKEQAQAAIEAASEAITLLEAGADTMTVAQIEGVVGGVRTQLAAAVDAVITAYGIKGYQAMAALHTLAGVLQNLGQALIDNMAALDVYTVVSAMTAVGIAAELYRDVDRAEEIVRGNGVVNPNRIRPGTVLMVRAS